MQKLHRSDFLKEVKSAFLQLTHEINQQLGLLNLEVHTFTRFVQSLIDEGDKDNLAIALQIADKYLREGNRNLTTALVVSFLEHLNFTDGKVSRSWAEEYLTISLKTAYDEIMVYNQRIQQQSLPRKQKRSTP